MNKKQVYESDIAYIAGLFDGEGSLHFKRLPEKKRSGTYNCMRISMEINMTCESVIRWVHETLGVGTVNKKTVKGKRADGTPYLKQWRWRCTFRDAYSVCRCIWPWVHVKLDQVQKVLDHYSEIDIRHKYEKGLNVIDFEKEKSKRV